MITDLSMANDADLAVALVARDPEALEILYQRHSSVILSVARRTTGDRARAEEVLQEVFLRMWKAPERFDATRGSLRAYLLMEAHARGIEVVRRDVARTGREDKTHRLVPDPGRHDSTADDAWDSVLAGHLHDALDELVEGERAAIELAYYGGYSYREVALILGEPEGTVKSRIRSGLHRLRDRLVAVDPGGVQ